MELKDFSRASLKKNSKKQNKGTVTGSLLQNEIHIFSFGRDQTNGAIVQFG
jgi:hypothetical protein